MRSQHQKEGYKKSIKRSGDKFVKYREGFGLVPSVVGDFFTQEYMQSHGG
jgi:hypothetical protein